MRTSSTDSTPANAAIPRSWPSVAVTAHTTGLLSASLKTTRLFWQACPTLRRDRLLFVHGSPNSQHEYLLPDMNAFAALERVETAGAETLFCGHTHQPYVRELSEGSIRVSVQKNGNHSDSEQEMTLPMRRIVNAGSVGEPRHGSTKATYVIHDDDNGAVRVREVDYDVAKTCRAIVEAGLPQIFAWRLSHGFEYAERAEDASHVCER